MPLRILHVTPYCEAAWGYGGIPRVVGALTRELAKRGHHVTVMSTDARDAASRLRKGEGDVEGLRSFVFPNVSNALAYHWQLFTPRGLGRELGRRVREFDIAHLHGCHHLPGAIAARVLERGSVPWVISPNGTAPHIERRRLAKLLFDRLLDRRSLPAAARALAVTAAEERQFALMGVESSKVRRLPNPVEAIGHTSKLDRGEFRARYDLGDTPIVAFLGKLSPRKRVDVLIDAFARLGRSDVRLVIAGNDMGAESDLRRQASRLGVDAVFTGLIRGSDRLSLLRDASVLVYPSQDEIFGLVPFEAMLCGTPALVADDSGCGEIMKGLDRGEWVLPLGDVVALIDALHAILRDPQSAAARADRAAAKIPKLYSPSVVVDSLEDVYREVLR